jgi:hypothetical protein
MGFAEVVVAPGPEERAMTAPALEIELGRDMGEVFLGALAIAFDVRDGHCFHSSSHFTAGA